MPQNVPLWKVPALTPKCASSVDKRSMESTPGAVLDDLSHIVDDLHPINQSQSLA
jgi:hypothetical protein